MKLISKISTAEAVVNYFKEEIQSKRLTRGDALPSERSLKDQFGISRFSLREGLARLNALGIIKIIHGKGAYVSDKIDDKSLSDVFLPVFTSPQNDIQQQLFESRFLIETEMAALSSKRRSDKDIEYLNACIEQMKKEIENPDAFSQADFEFHQRIAISAKNVFLDKMHRVLNQQLKSFLITFSKVQNNCEQAIQEHEGILKAIQDKNESKVRKLIQKHLKFSHTHS